MRPKLFAFITAAALALTSSAQAAMLDYTRIGAWTAARGLNDAGVPMCSIRTAVARDRTVYVKWQPGSGDTVYLQLIKTSWRVPQGVAMPIDIAFDNGTSFSGEATGISIASGIEVAISADDRLRFLRQFTDAWRMSVGFPGGNERTWVADLTGSEAITQAFLDCIIDLARNDTQPYVGGPATQPYSRL